MNPDSLGTVVPLRGAMFYVTFTYSLGLTLINTIALVWLFIRSPRHRWPAGLMLAAHITSRAVNALHLFASRAILGWDPLLAGLLIAFGIYALALFGFRILDPLPAARQAAIEQMRDGLVVLDTGRSSSAVLTTVDGGYGQVSGIPRSPSGWTGCRSSAIWIVRTTP